MISVVSAFRRKITGAALVNFRRKLVNFRLRAEATG